MENTVQCQLDLINNKLEAIMMLLERVLSEVAYTGESEDEDYVEDIELSDSEEPQVVTKRPKLNRSSATIGNHM